MPVLFIRNNDRSENPDNDKKHGYKQYSYFRYGLDFITGILMQNFNAGLEVLAICFNKAHSENRREILSNRLETVYA